MISVQEKARLALYLIELARTIMDDDILRWDVEEDRYPELRAIEQGCYGYVPGKSKTVTITIEQWLRENRMAQRPLRARDS